MFAFHAAARREAQRGLTASESTTADRRSCGMIFGRLFLNASVELNDLYEPYSSRLALPRVFVKVRSSYAAVCLFGRALLKMTGMTTTLRYDESEVLTCY